MQIELSAPLITKEEVVYAIKLLKNNIAVDFDNIPFLNKTN